MKHLDIEKLYCLMKFLKDVSEVDALILEGKELMSSAIKCENAWKLCQGTSWHHASAPDLYFKRAWESHVFLLFLRYFYSNHEKNLYNVQLTALLSVKFKYSLFRTRVVCYSLLSFFPCIVW